MGAAWALAVENGWKPPKWAKPPTGIDHTQLKVSVLKKVEAFKKAMEEIEDMDTPLERKRPIRIWVRPWTVQKRR